MNAGEPLLRHAVILSRKLSRGKCPCHQSKIERALMYLPGTPSWSALSMSSSLSLSRRDGPGANERGFVIPPRTIFDLRNTLCHPMTPYCDHTRCNTKPLFTHFRH